MTIRHIRIFMAVYEHGGNVTKAAEALHMSQPAVSLALRELEEYYGIRLFERNSRHLQIAEAGKKFAEYAMNITELFDDMEDNMRSWDTGGPVKIGASITIGSQFMPGYVTAFNARFPDSRVRVLIAPGEVLEKKVLNNELDFALVEGAVHDPALISHTYMHDRLALVTKPSPAFDSNRNIPLRDFLKLQFLLREKGSGTREVFDNAVEKAGFTVEPVWEAYSTTALLNAAEAGLGAAALPYRMVMNRIKSGRVIELIPEGLDFHRNFHIVYRKHKHLTSAAKSFMELCINYEPGEPHGQYSGID